MLGLPLVFIAGESSPVPFLDLADDMVDLNGKVAALRYRN
jgi:hypothetical protein